MKVIFWGAVLLVGYTYLGYPAWLWLRSRLRPCLIRRASHLPFISVVLVVRNEEGVLQRKITNLLNLDYPPDRLEFVVVSDGSTDMTNEILKQFSSDSRFRVILQPASGKATGLNKAITGARAGIVVFTDARQEIESDALRLLMENFADEQVGCASGELILGDRSSGEAGTGMGLYWRIEKSIRELESLSGSVVGATGALYGVRRALLVPVPPETILDDVYVPMNVARQGARVVFDGRAHVWDTANLGSEREFGRKVRTLAGNYQLLQLAPWLLTRSNPIRFEFISHKLLRLTVPFALAAMLALSLVLREPIYRLALLFQFLFYGLSILALLGLKKGPLARMADAAATFVVLNTAALVAFTNFVTGRRTVWVP